MSKSYRKWLALGLLVMLALPLGAKAGNQTIRKYVLFNGTNAADSTERASIWFPVRGATRIYFRTWSAGAIADTDFCDTITTWKTLLSDSVLFMARDSAGSIVTARSTIPTTSVHGESYPMCADSVVITNELADSLKMVGVKNPVEGVGTPVRGSASGSGIWSYAFPTPVQAAIPNVALNAQVAGTNDFIMASYMRLRITPRTRLTSAGTVSTAGLRTRGLNKLKIEAYVVFGNQ